MSLVIGKDKFLIPLVVWASFFFVALADADIPPAAPTGLSATTTAGTTQINLNWGDNSEADLDHYVVYRSITRGDWEVLNSATASWLYDSNVVYGSVFWYVVTAVDDEGQESAYSDDAHATPNPDDVVAPSHPLYLEATGTDSKVFLQWTPPVGGGLDSHRIYRSTTSGKYYDYVAGVSEEVSSFEDTGVTNGVKYYYVVTAVDTNNNESEDSEEAYATPTAAADGGDDEEFPDNPAGPTRPRGDSGCFVATAAYGTPFRQEVEVLCRFREKFLAGNDAGRLFLKAYYRLSPEIADFIRKKPLLKLIVRLYLKPWVKLASFAVSH